MLNIKVVSSVLALTVALFIVCCEAQEKYSDKYDYVNVDTILSSTKQRNQYYRCFSGESPCLTPDAKFFRDHFGEAVITNCKKCTEKQKIAFDKITVWYTENEPERYKAIIEKAINDARSRSKH